MGEPLTVTRKSGFEKFHRSGSALGFDVLDFWKWADSDLMGNALRSRLAEFLVARALGIAAGTRTEWDAFDLMTPTGTKIEVKSAVYVQSWPQKRPSLIKFAIQPTLGWDAATNTDATVCALRQSEIYVFALLHRERDTADPLNLEHWEFYVLAASVLNERHATQKTIALSSLLKLRPKRAMFAELAEAIDSLIPLTPSPRITGTERVPT